MSDRDYYEILGLTARADGAMVDQAYWHLARKYQALLETNPRAKAMLDELNEAYGVLGTPRLRQEYDAFREDVLVRSGAVEPVASRAAKARRSKKREQTKDGARAISRRLPPVLAVRSIDLRARWRPMAGGLCLIAAMAISVVLGISPVVVLGVVCVAGAVLLVRGLRRDLPDVNLTLPEVVRHDRQAARPQPTKAKAPAPRHAGDETANADALRASTAAMIARWRGTMGLQTPPSGRPAPVEPSTALVDIVETERELETANAPLAAVIDILRGSNRGVESK